MVDGVNHDVEPYAEDAGDEHFPELRLVGYAECLHQAFEEISQWVGCDRPDNAYGCPEQERVSISMGGLAGSEQPYDQDF